MSNRTVEITTSPNRFLDIYDYAFTIFIHSRSNLY